MANIRVNITYNIFDGAEITFKSPADCSDVTGLRVYYFDDSKDQKSMDFKFADAHKNDVTDIDELFASDAVVKVILDISSGMAFVQNGDTNAYLEKRFKELSAPVDISDSFILTEHLPECLQLNVSYVVKLGNIISGTIIVAVNRREFNRYDGDPGFISINELYAPTTPIFITPTVFSSDSGTRKPIYNAVVQLYSYGIAIDLNCVTEEGDLEIVLSFMYVCGDEIEGWSP